MKHQTQPRPIAIFIAILTMTPWSDRIAYAADFNGDGFADLVIGSPLEDLAAGAAVDAGAVNVIYGSSTGLKSAGDDFWHQDVAGVNETADSGDQFGSSFAVGDFNDDGFDDLAIGTPLEDVGSIVDAGAVCVLYGSSTGLKPNGDQLWHQDQPSINDVAEEGDRFGSALAAGDFDNDGFDDLAIGAPGEDVGAIVDAGLVNVLYGSSSKLKASGDQSWTQDSPGIVDLSEEGDSFGGSLAAGDFDEDGRDDLAIGVPAEDIDVIFDAGAVNVLYGSNNKLRAVGDQFWHQDSEGIMDAAENDDHFATLLISGDFDHNGADDLAIAIPDEDVDVIADAGAVAVIYGGGSGLRQHGDQFWHQDVAGIAEAAENSDRFGNALAAGDFDDDGHDDLAIGVGTEDLDLFEDDAGVVHVLYGTSPAGLSASGDELWEQDTEGLLKINETFDNFGTALAAGDFDDDGHSDLATSIPAEDTGGVKNAGAVLVQYGANSGLSTSGEQLWYQDSGGIGDAGETDDFFGSAMGP